MAAARSEAANGTGFIRSHVDVTDPELTALRAIVQLREDVKNWIEIQIVAFPQNSVLSFPDGPRLLERALIPVPTSSAASRTTRPPAKTSASIPLRQHADLVSVPAWVAAFAA